MAVAGSLADPLLALVMTPGALLDFLKHGCSTAPLPDSGPHGTVALSRVPNPLTPSLSPAGRGGLPCSWQLSHQAHRDMLRRSLLTVVTGLGEGQTALRPLGSIGARAHPRRRRWPALRDRAGDRGFADAPCFLLHARAHGDLLAGNCMRVAGVAAVAPAHQ